MSPVKVSPEEFFEGIEELGLDRFLAERGAAYVLPERLSEAVSRYNVARDNVVAELIMYSVKNEIDWYSDF